MKKFVSLLFAFVLIAGLISGAVTAPVAAVDGIARPEYSGRLIDITPQRIDDTFSYLDEMYVQKHPEAALVIDTGTEKDRHALKTLAEKITAGCETDTEKANAIEAWIQKNISFDNDASVCASDTFYDRVGNHLGFANLMKFLLRSVGIPAVVGSGWRGDMAEYTVDFFEFTGHAWCFVQLNGEWVVYDPLYLSGGTSDRDYMAKWLYFDAVEFVTPASDSGNLPPEIFDPAKAYYTNGRTYLWSEYYGSTLGELFVHIGNQRCGFITNQDDPETGTSDGWLYLYSDYDKSTMNRGDAYCDSWISYGDYSTGNATKITYTNANGTISQDTVMTLDGQDYLMDDLWCEPILAGKDDYSIINGTFTLKPGYTGPFLGTPWQDGVAEGNIVSWENQTPEIATVDDDGIITCHAEGIALFNITLKRPEDGGTFTLLDTCSLAVSVSSAERIPSYGDTTGHICSYTVARVVEPNCVHIGITHMICSCGNTYLADPRHPTGVHTYLDSTDATCEVCSYTRVVLPEDTTEEEGIVSVYRLYNPYTQEHLLTSSRDEGNQLISVDWQLDGTAWKAPTEGSAVYRLYNPYDDWHIYSMSQDEIDTLTPLGWVVDGVVFCSADASDGLPIYRLFNPYETKNYHLLTASKEEADWLAGLGWILEGVAMFGKE